MKIRLQFKHVFLTLTIMLGFSLYSFAQEPTILRHSGRVNTVAFSPMNSSLLASGTEHNIIKLWNLREETVTTLRGHTGTVNSVAFSPDGQLLASGSDDWTFKLWDVNQPRNIATLGHITDRTRSQIKAVAFSPDGRLLATAGWNVKLWDVSKQTEIANLRNDTWVWTVAFSHDGQYLAAGDGSGTVNIWHVQNRQVIARLTGDTNSVYSVKFSPDNRLLASSGYEGHIKLWDVANWELIGTLSSTGTVHEIDFSIDGKMLASTGHESVTLWNVESGAKIATLTEHTGWVTGVTFSHDGTTLASAGEDQTVRIRNIETFSQILQQREMIRLIYFIPINRRPQRDIDTKIDTLVKDVQRFYAQQMQSHGFGRKTFTFETDATGNAVVHQISGKFTDLYYQQGTFDKVVEEIETRFDMSKNIYLIAIEVSNEAIDIEWCGTGGARGASAGIALIPASGACFDQIRTAAHELGHAFGLEHDFRNDAYLMSYGGMKARLSYCAAEWLDVHRLFNTSHTSFNEPAMIQMLPPVAYPDNAIHFRFEINDSDGLHQAQLFIPTTARDPADGIKLHKCQSITGQSITAAFTTTQLNVKAGTEVILKVIDVHGGFTQGTYPISVNKMAHVDINSDGTVDVADLILVASHFGSSAVRTANPNPDINGDGVIDLQDLLLVVVALESLESAAAPALTVDTLQKWLIEAKQHNIGDETFQKGIALLEQLLAPSISTETALLHNYPNPFNPETWIPYQLAKDADVTLTIYAADGTVVRTLALGHQSAGIYHGKSRAMYWDGTNEIGEQVSSGFYFYTLTAGDFTATRKMLILK